MAEVKLIVEDEIKRLKKEIKSLRKDLGREDVAKEELLTFEMLEKYPHITQQQAWPWRWKNVDALYMLTDEIPASVVDDAVMATWASGEQGLPNSYTNWCMVPKYCAAVDYTPRLRAPRNLPRCSANSDTCKAVANHSPGSATANSYLGTTST